MKNILITGANGLLGAEFKARLTDEEAWFCGHADLDITDFEAVRRFLKGRKIPAVTPNISRIIPNRPSRSA